MKKIPILAVIGRMKSLKLKFFAIILGLFVLWTCLGVYINVYRYQKMTRDEVIKDADNAATLLAGSLSQYVANMDATGLESALVTIMADKEVAYVKVTDPTGGVIKEVGVQPKDAPDAVPAMKDIMASGRKVGSITVGLTGKGNGRVMWLYVLLQGFAVSVLGVITLYVLMVSFNKMALEPLARMNAILKGMAAGGGDLTQRLHVGSEDEIGELAANFNTFLGRLRDMVARAQDASFRVIDLTSAIRAKSKSFLSSAQEQVQTTNDNFRAIEKMTGAIQDIAGSAESLNITAMESSSAVTEMSAQVEAVADNTMDLSTHIEETSSSITEMSMSIKEVAENVRAVADAASMTASSVGQIDTAIKEVERLAKESAELSQEVSTDAATLGNEAIASTIEGMERIKETVDEASGVIERLGLRSAEIGQILKVIDEVTNQTSLLALNAAILAAQAGEHGKGFAVVADEIKDLAERTSSSTGEIAKLIKAVQKESKAAVDSMRAGRERVMEGHRLAYEAADALRKILESSDRSKDSAVAIEKATTRQVAAVRQMAETMTDLHNRIQSIERATIEQSKGGELISASAEKINDIVKEVRGAMNEQAKGIKEFARNLDDTKDLAGTIADSTRSQGDESQLLVNSMEKILDIAQGNSELSTELERAVEDLVRQAQALRDEMGGFKV